jgi:hypothetical protein
MLCLPTSYSATKSISPKVTILNPPLPFSVQNPSTLYVLRAIGGYRSRPYQSHHKNDGDIDGDGAGHG